MSALHTIPPEMSLPDLFEQFPQTRAVFNQYGLRGCGGHTGPAESIQFFAQAHGVDLPSLLDQLHNVIHNQAKATQAQAQLKQDAKPRLIDAIYRPYFLAAMFVMLTAGAAWGVLLLIKIGQNASFTGISVLEINAHGHAQIMGWVGLFIIGFAYQAFPRMWHCDLAKPQLAPVVLCAILVGMTLRIAAMYAHQQPWAIAAHTAGSVLEVAAVLVLSGQLWMTFHRSEQPISPYLGFVFTALVFLILQTIYSSWHMDRLLSAVTREQLIAQISGWQSPLRDMQIHGMALLMIVGVSMRMFPAIFGLPKTTSRRAWTSLGLLLAAVLLEVVVFTTMTLTAKPAVAAFLLLPWLILPVGVGLIVWPWKLWRPMPVIDRSAKFIRVAYAWLYVSFGMLLLLPVYIFISGQDFSHAYYGSARHAITVGFISLMIVGMSSKIAPTLRGVSPEKLPSLWSAFVLINLGCALRVLFQIGTDWHPIFFKITGISGVLEWTGFAIWAWHMTAVMLGLGRYTPDDPQAIAKRWGSPTLTITPGHHVAQVLAWYPLLQEVFVVHGFDLITRPALRKTLATQVTLKQACAMKNVPLDEFIKHLNTAKRDFYPPHAVSPTQTTPIAATKPI